MTASSAPLNNPRTASHRRPIPRWAGPWSSIRTRLNRRFRPARLTRSAADTTRRTGSNTTSAGARPAMPERIPSGPLIPSTSTQAGPRWPAGAGTLAVILSWVGRRTSSCSTGTVARACGSRCDKSCSAPTCVWSTASAWTCATALATSTRARTTRSSGCSASRSRGRPSARGSGPHPARCARPCTTRARPTAGAMARSRKTRPATTRGFTESATPARRSSR